MGNTCLAQSGVMEGKEAEKPGKFFAGDGKHGAAVAVEKTRGGNGAFSVISRPVSAEPKSTRGFSSRKVYKIATRIFYRSRRASKVEATQNIIDKYLIERRPPIGRGYFGVVRTCVDKQTGEEFAVKTILKIKVTRMENLRREVTIMRRLSHPHIIKLRDVFEDETFIHLVMEMCRGGDLMDKMIEKRESEEGRYTEEGAKVIVSQILSGIVYCHNELNICHRDLKLENLLLKGPNIKIIDFGLSRFVDGLSSMTTFAGTPYYMAPEIFARNYNRACDLWSLGVITFILLSGNVPFDGETDQEVFAAVKNGYFDFKAPEWNNISKNAKGFITQLLKKDPSARMTATQAMEHPWLQRRTTEPWSP